MGQISPKDDIKIHKISFLIVKNKDFKRVQRHHSLNEKYMCDYYERYDVFVLLRILRGHRGVSYIQIKPDRRGNEATLPN